ncbi:MAG: ATP-dependent Clp protease ATP-binding subunit, partial [Acidobacteria bacterium]|nr:ATP-dependent Clp protease ATP-binding subunit [Acidobacteriota bacterium]
MRVDDLDVPLGKLSDAVQRIVDVAASVAHRRAHGELTTGHLFFGFVQVEWTTFAGLLRDLDVNPNEIVLAIEEQLNALPSGEDGVLRVPQATRLVAKLALHRATRAGRGIIETADLVVALLEETHGMAASVLRGFGVEPSTLLTRVMTTTSEQAARDEQLTKRLELPAALKQFATSLNLLARQDRLPPVFGREREIQQMLEILSHRERASSVMLLGEAGVGKTAIVEELARRLELQPEDVPLRLRDCQIVSLPMNALVAGTMLRGMFEERLQHVIHELKERPNLILFVDEAHTLIGAGSALGAPADAANILKSVLARGEIRLIAATTFGEYKEHIREDEALARRFRCIQVAEPSIEETRRILHKLRPRLERNYTVRIQDEAIETALEMAPRYMRHQHLPDKVIGWLDTAAVRAEMSRRWHVTREDVTSVISDAAQIPPDMVVRDVTRRFKDIEQRLQLRIVGQRNAVTAVAQRLVLNKGPLKDGFDRPDGVLLFLG